MQLHGLNEPLRSNSWTISIFSPPADKLNVFIDSRDVLLSKRDEEQDARGAAVRRYSTRIR